MKATGVLLGAAGALSLIFLKPEGSAAGATALGDLFILINAMSYGVYLVLVGIERWIAEIYRVRLETTLGMSTAQWFSVAVVLAGLYLLVTRWHPRTQAALKS